MYDELGLTFILAFLIAMAFSPIAIKVAHKIGAIAEGVKKLQKWGFPNISERNIKEMYP